jgi:hypothetical protein
MRDFTISEIACGVASQCPVSVSCLPFFMSFFDNFRTQLPGVLHAASRIQFHNFVSPYLCFSKKSMPGTSLLWSKSDFTG